MTPNIITTIYVSRTPLQSCTAFWNYISKTGKTRKNVGYKCMYALQNVLHYKHKRQKHVSKKPSISLEETTYLPTLYTVVHGYKHGVTCCLHSELKSAAQAWHTHTHTHTDHVFASGNKAAVLTPTAIYFFILDVHMPGMFNTHTSLSYSMACAPVYCS